MIDHGPRHAIVAPAPADAATRRNSRARRSFALELTAGIARDWISWLPLTMATVDAAPGISWEWRDIAFDLLCGVGYARGSTPFGLRTEQVTFRPGVQWRASHISFGAGMRIAYLSIARATRPGNLATTLVGAELHLGFEPFSWSGHAIMIETRVHYDTDGESSIPGVSVHAGVRF